MKLSHADMRWNELMDEYFFCRSVRVATEWSYLKVLNGFRKFVGETLLPEDIRQQHVGNDSNLLIVFYVQIMPDDFVMQLHRF